MTSLMVAAVLLVAQEPYEKRVRPLVERYCFDCHGEGAKKGGLALDGHSDAAARLRDRKLWHKVSLFLQSHVMPPPGKPKPSKEERRVILDWIENTVFHVDPDRPDPGHVTLRRLNRAEYNNSVRDVFGVAARPADAFPPDDSGYGFDNVGDVLALSPMLMEKVLAAAREVVYEATRPVEVVKVGALVPGRSLERVRGKTRLQGPVVVVEAGGAAGFTPELPAEGAYRVSLRAAAVFEGKGPGRVTVRCGGRKVAVLEIRQRWTGQVKRFGAVRERVLLPKGRHAVTFEADSGLAIYQAELHGPYTPVLPGLSPFLERELGPDAVIGDPRLLMSGEDLQSGEGKSSLDTGKSWFSSNGFRRVRFDTVTAGRYRLSVRAGGQQAGPDPVRFEIRLGDTRLGPFEVKAKAQQPAWISAETDLAAGSHDMQVWFVNAFTDKETGARRLLWVHELSVDGPLGRERTLTAGGVAPVLKRTGRRLYRRPLTFGEAAKLDALATRALEAGAGPMDALRVGLTALLASPHYLYWNAPRPAGPEKNGIAPVDEFALASRLSAFLWSSVPDETLLDLAERGLLGESLPGQVARMVADPRAEALTSNFAGQWLQLRDMDLVSPDPARFPGFDRDLARDMRLESELLFAHILRGNRPIREFLSAEYTFLNQRLANHYGIEGVEGNDHRRVSLVGTRRRGVLTHASLLTMTSHPTRTSPVKRGKFILERILGTPPPPAPADVPSLEEAAKEKPGASFREQMDLHRSDRGCAACHAYLDPMGFALEHFDAVGRFRNRVDGGPVDASGRLVTGEAFQDFGELRTLLEGSRLRMFAKALAEQLLTYALGRGVEYTDKHEVAKIVERALRPGAGMGDLILAVCESVPFRMMRGPNWNETR